MINEGELINKETLSDQAYQVIKNKILAKEYLPGMRLKDDQISKELGISKTPIQAAMKALSKEGLVKISPRSGTFVRDFDPEEVTELFTVREVLEELALELSWNHLNPGELNVLKKRFEKAREEIIDSKNTTKAIEADLVFHMHIVNRCANSILNHMLTEILTLSHFFMIHKSKSFDEYIKACDDHVEIIIAILENNKSKALSLQNRHIRDAKHRLQLLYLK